MAQAEDHATKNASLPRPTDRLRAPYAVIRANWFLMRSLVVRDVDSRVRGTVLGKVWIAIGPLFMLAVYTLVFGVILGSRWQDQIGRASCRERVSSPV